MTQARANSIQREIAVALREQVPVRDLTDVSIKDVQQKPEQPFDISFELRSGRNRIRVFGEAKQTFTPRMISEIIPWIKRLKSLRPDLVVALLAPVFTDRAQTFCIESGVDFVDLAGNISINVPGKFTLRRTGMRARALLGQKSAAPSTSNVFSGRYSRLLRVLLENPKQWTLTEIDGELKEQSIRFSERFPQALKIDFTISRGAISKAIASLEEQLWIRRRGMALVVPEPARLLEQWAEKYKERYRWRLRSSFQTANPFGVDLASILGGLEQLVPGMYALTSAMAASVDSPFVDIDVVDVLLLSGKAEASLRKLTKEPSRGPSFRFINPYDDGVFMYARQILHGAVVSGIQAFLDLYARGGRDLKQAEHLLENMIKPKWGRYDS
ncbi:MAG TPA: hypothetical protein VG649_05195 [Candidatus Angelobacter sp.]|nr:hypothetical protein [Candidatus Angelobacter sp.]